MNSNYRDYILAKIDEIHKSKIGAVRPAHVTLSELSGAMHEDLRNELNELFREGRIKVGDTINGKYIADTAWDEEA